MISCLFASPAARNFPSSENARAEMSPVNRGFSILVVSVIVVPATEKICMGRGTAVRAFWVAAAGAVSPTAKRGAVGEVARAVTGEEIFFPSFVRTWRLRRTATG